MKKPIQKVIYRYWQKEVYDDHELVIQKRVQHSDLLKGWKR